MRKVGSTACQRGTDLSHYVSSNIQLFGQRIRRITIIRVRQDQAYIIGPRRLELILLYIRDARPRYHKPVKYPGKGRIRERQGSTQRLGQIREIIAERTTGARKGVIEINGGAVVFHRNILIHGISYVTGI